MISHTLCNVQFERDVPGEQHFPLWPCPACEHGVLQLSGQTVSWASSAQIGYGIDQGYLDQWDDRGVFCAALTCANPACQQGVAVLGDYSNHTPDGIYMAWGRGPEFRVVRHYEVRAIHPAPKLIDIPKDISETIVAAIERSFALYWSDPQACATTIRTAIEETADSLGERRLDQRGRPISLSAHLQDLATKHPKLVEAFSIITKTLGNAGAHGDPVERTSLLIAYELLEIELQSLSADVVGRRDGLIAKLR